MVYSETNSGLEEIPVAVVSGWGLEKVNLSIPLFFFYFFIFTSNMKKLTWITSKFFYIIAEFQESEPSTCLNIFTCLEISPCLRRLFLLEIFRTLWRLLLCNPQFPPLPVLILNYWGPCWRCPCHCEFGLKFTSDIFVSWQSSHFQVSRVCCSQHPRKVLVKLLF